jgi:sulfur carrier protein
MPASGNSLDTVLVNGAARPLRATGIAELLRELGHDPAMPGLAVAVNDKVVTRSQWHEVTLAPNDRIEIVFARQGG